MGNRIWKRTIAFIFCMLLVCGSLSALAEEEKISHSTKNYEVVIQNASKVFLGNAKKVDWKVGDKYFLTYTVDSVSGNLVQSGLACTDDPTVDYPHSPESKHGGMKYATSNLLCEKGYTYFLRFEVTKDGMTYIAAKAKGGESEYLSDFINEWPNQYVPGHEGYTWQKLTAKNITNFGAWFAEGGEISAKLSHVRCYDEKGNDLGIYGNKRLGVFVQDGSYDPMPGIEHSYKFSLDKAEMIFFGSERPTKSKTIFLEYTVKNVKAKNVNQTGGIMTSDPTVDYPHTVGIGYMNYQQHTAETGPAELVTEGATYMVRFDRTEKGFEATVKRTVNGQVSYFSFPHYWGTESNEWPLAGVWIGEKCSVTADFVDVKCYDAEGNNLAITTNQGVTVEHFGSWEDYSKCEAVYYCEANNTFVALDDECNASKRVDSENLSKTGTYSITGLTLDLKIGDKKEKFDYFYTFLTDKDGNRYNRLSDSTVTFHSRYMGGDAVETAEATAATGFKVAKPADPKEEGRTFKFWKTGTDEEFDFNSVVTQNTDLYAVWDGETSIEEVSAQAAAMDPKGIIVVVSSVVLVGATAAGVVMIGRGKRNGK